MTGRIITVTNQKGGVGKTTTAINLAASLALADQRILVVDLDPQGNLTSGVGLRGQRRPGGTIYDALTSDLPPAPDMVILPTIVDQLFAVPADGNLTGAEIELVAASRPRASAASLARAAARRSSISSSSTRRRRSACSR